jgi:seryl-tRNA synthetase
MLDANVGKGPVDGNDASSRELSAADFYDGLVEHKLIIPVGVPGAFGRGAAFEDVLARFDALVSQVAEDDGAERMLFPPILDREVLERSEFLESFPQLAGSVFSFEGREKEHAELVARLHERKPWDDLQAMTAVVLTPAACYPVYPSLAGTLPAEGRLIDMQNWVFRHEPSPEPTRMQAFRVREGVRVATPEKVVAWRDEWLARGLSMLESLGLPVRAEEASDPFFGRVGKMLAESQREQRLKFELTVPVISVEKPTAVASFNYHQDHFGKIFGINTHTGSPAHSACLGFGLERVVMALFRTHGFVTRDWPPAVRDKLWG